MSSAPTPPSYATFGSRTWPLGAVPAHLSPSLLQGLQRSTAPLKQCTLFRCRSTYQPSIRGGLPDHSTCPRSTMGEPGLPDAFPDRAVGPRPEVGEPGLPGGFLVQSAARVLGGLARPAGEPGCGLPEFLSGMASAQPVDSCTTSPLGEISFCMRPLSRGDNHSQQVMGQIKIDVKNSEMIVCIQNIILQY